MVSLHHSLTLTASILAGALVALPAHAQLQTLRLHGEGGGDLIVGGEPSRRFNPGGHLALRASFPLIPQLRIQAGSANFWFPAEQGSVGRLITAEAGLRAAPLAKNGAAEGLVLQANGGIGLTGDLERFVFDLGVGWEFLVSRSVSVGPMLSYTHLVQPDSKAGPDDARFIGLGVLVTLGIPVDEGANAAGDADDDGVSDDEDRCPKQAEDVDGYQDDDGCPDPDNDSDGIADVADKCPSSAETRNGYQDADGCPDQPPAATAQPTQPPPSPPPPGEGNRLEQRVYFAYRGKLVRVGQLPAAQAACDYMKSHPDEIVRIHGHADEAGPEGYNYALSAERAGNVARWLIRCGVESKRILVQAHGENAPSCTSENVDCQEHNRRVEFEVFKP